MPKCYLMVEDVEDGTDAGQVQFAVDFGVPVNEDGFQQLPQSVEEMTPAQEAIWNFYNVLKGMFDRQHKTAMQREVARTVVVPDHVANEDKH